MKKRPPEGVPPPTEALDTLLPDVTRLPYTKRKTPFWPKVADPWK